ncbi:MAG: ferrous iron transport protein B [Verrucomicrobia bacterium]|nr:ferrous iron transport protein B [Verrucomicrobiota bacterium]
MTTSSATGQSGGEEPRAESPTAAHPAKPTYVALTGNPNCGKTTLFNALTGLRAKVGNYAGVTVERKEGRLIGAPSGHDLRVLDLPGTYSLSPQSLDEQISRDVLLNRLPELPPPSLMVVVVDASNLQRNLYYATQVVELGHPTIIALNMVDVAEQNGQVIDAAKLSEVLGVPVLPVVASAGRGVPELREAMVRALQSPANTRPRQFCQLPGPFRIEATKLSDLLAETFHERRNQATAEALLLLSNERALASSASHYPRRIQEAVAAARQRLETQGVDWRGAPIEWRYARVAEIQQAVTTASAPPGETFSDKLDRVLTHKVWGTIIFVAIMALIFQSIFTFAEHPMNWLEGGVTWLGGLIEGAMPPGDLRDLLVKGVIAGVGAVVVFLPQILLLFLFIGFLEDTGYMARAAFLMDRVMSRVGLHGKSFIPMLSSFACAIPGIMATRTIESPKDRLVTILVAPLMSCSARLPVYTLLIAACIPQRTVFGFFKLTGLTMLAMYLLGIVVALLMAWLFKRTLLKGETPMLIMELPPYKRPLLRVVLRHMWDRSKIFLRRAGTVILGISIVLWFLATYPRSGQLEEQFETRRAAITNTFSAVSLPTATGSDAGRLAELEDQLTAVDKEEAGEKLRHSFAGRLGRLIEPVIAPLGFDWKIGIGIVASFAAREVFVSTMSTVYNVGDFDDSEAGLTTLADTLKSQVRPDGAPVYTTLTGITLMIFYVFALQCVSTVAVVRRETNSWKWPLFQWLYMGVLAWVFAFVAYQGGRLLGFE